MTNNIITRCHFCDKILYNNKVIMMQPYYLIGGKTNIYFCCENHKDLWLYCNIVRYYEGHIIYSIERGIYKIDDIETKVMWPTLEKAEETIDLM